MAEAAGDRHSAYYAAAWERWFEDFKGPRRQAALAEIDLEFEDVRAAWEWAAERAQVGHLSQSSVSLHYHLMWRERCREGEAAFRLAAAKLTQALEGPSSSVSAGTLTAKVPGVPPQDLRVLALLLALQSFFSTMLRHRELADQLAQRSGAILDSLELAGEVTRRERAWLLVHMGTIAHWSGDFEAFRPVTGQALALFRELGDSWMIAELLR